MDQPNTNIAAAIKGKYVDKEVTLVIGITRVLISAGRSDPLGNISAARLLNPQPSDKRGGSSRSLQRIVRVIEPLQLHHGEAVAVGRRRLIPVHITNTHSVLPIILHDLQLNFSTTPTSLDGESALLSHTEMVNLRDRYTAATLDIDAFPITVMPGDEYHCVVTLEPSMHPRGPTLVNPSNLKNARSHSLTHIYSTTRRTGSSSYTILDQLAAVWSILCSPCLIMSLHSIPNVLPPPRDLVISFDGMVCIVFVFINLWYTGKSPAQVNVVFSVCFTITNLADYSRDLTFIIPPPSVPMQVSMSAGVTILSHFNSSKDLPVAKVLLPAANQDVTAGVEEERFVVVLCVYCACIAC